MHAQVPARLGPGALRSGVDPGGISTLPAAAAGVYPDYVDDMHVLQARAGNVFVY